MLIDKRERLRLALADPGSSPVPPDPLRGELSNATVCPLYPVNHGHERVP